MVPVTVIYMMGESRNEITIPVSFCDNSNQIRERAGVLIRDRYPQGYISIISIEITCM